MAQLQAQLPQMDEVLAKELSRLNFSFCVADCTLPDCPIVYASQGFYDLTGYSAAEVLSRNCRFMQGPGTSRAKVAEMRDAIREERACEVCLLNYKKDGTPFWNQFYLAPATLGDSSMVTHYLGIQADVTQQVEEAEAAAGLAAADEKLPGLDSLSSLHSIPSLHSNQEGDFRLANEEQQKAVSLQGALSRWDSEHRRSSAELFRSSSGISGRSSGGLSSPALPVSLLAPLLKLQQSFVLSDPSQPDCPIVHASQGFLALTGYPRDQVLGRNCRFLQGEGTDPEELQRLRDALSAEPPRAVTVRLLNFCYDGTPFWNSLHVAPVRNAAGQVVFLAGIQLDVTRVQPPAKAATSQHTLTRFGLEPRAAVERQPGHIRALRAGQGELSSELGPDVHRLRLSAAEKASAAAREALAPGVAAPSGVAAGHSHARDSSVSASLGPLRTRLDTLPECGEVTPGHKAAQRGVVGAVRVACRSLCPRSGLRRSLEDQVLPGTPVSAPSMQRSSLCRRTI